MKYHWGNISGFTEDSLDHQFPDLISELGIQSAMLAAVWIAHQSDNQTQKLSQRLAIRYSLKLAIELKTLVKSLKKHWNDRKKLKIFENYFK